MPNDEESPKASRGAVIRPPQFQGSPQPDDEAEPSIRVQLKVDSESDEFKRKITRFVTTGLRSTDTAIAVTNKDPNFRVLVHTVETTYPNEIVLAVVFTAVLNLSAIYQIELTEEKIGALGLNEEQTAALRELKVGADLHHMALEHGLKFLYSSGRQRTIQPYESILSLRAWTCGIRDLPHVVNELIMEFERSVLQRQPENQD